VIEGKGRGKEGRGEEMDAPFQIPEYAIETGVLLTLPRGYGED